MTDEALLKQFVRNAVKAARLAAKKVRQEHHEKGLPIVIWKDGKIAKVKV